MLFLLVLEGGFWWGAAQKQGFWLLFAVSEAVVVQKCIGWKSCWDQPAWGQQSPLGHIAISWLFHGLSPACTDRKGKV